jgi:DNA primase
VRQLRRFARRLVLAFDPDAAGAAAAERVYAWEQAHELEVVVADLPPGQDPGDLARSDPERLRAAVEKPTPFLGFRVERALAAGRLDTPEGRARTAETALAVIAEHPSDFVRDQYVMEVADRCRIDVSRLRSSLARGGGVGGAAVGRRVAVAAPPPRTRIHSEDPEVIALRLAVDADHRAAMVPLLHEVLFATDLHARACRALRVTGGDLHRAIEEADPDAAELLQRLAAEDETGDPVDVRRVLLRLQAERELEIVQREVHEASEDQLRDRFEVQRWLKDRLQAIAPEARPGREVEDQLLAWLAERAEERS